MKYNRVFLSLFFIITLLSPAMHAEGTKVVVCVEHTGTDSIGQRLVFAVREAIRASTGYTLGDKTEAAVAITLTTLNPNANTLRKTGISTISSVVFTMTNPGPYKKNNPQTWYPLYLTSLVVNVGESRVDAYGKSILADLDSAIEVYNQAVREK